MPKKVKSKQEKTGGKLNSIELNYILDVIDFFIVDT